MIDNIWDEQTGAHLAFIKDKKVFRATDGAQIAEIEDDKIIGLSGETVGYLTSLGSSKNAIAPPDAFKKLLAQ